MKTEILYPSLTNIQKCVKILKNGGIIAFPTETVYGLGANGFNENAVPKIFDAKGRPQTNPLTLHVCSYEQIRKAAYVSDDARILIERFMPGPLTIVLKKKTIVPSVTVAGGETVAVRMPNNKIALDLIKMCGFPLAAPSANSSARPSPTKAEHVKEDLEGKVGYILDGGECELGIESTIIDLSKKQPIVLRKGAISVEDISQALDKEILDNAILDKTKIPAGYMPKIKLFYVKNVENFQSYYQGNDSYVIGLKKPEFVDKEKFINIGKSKEEYAKNLFSYIRDCEQKNIPIIYCIGVDNNGIGETINSRLEKLCNGNII